MQSYNLNFPSRDPYNNLALIYDASGSDAAPTTPPSGLRTFDNTPGGSFACQNPAQPIANNPAEIAGVRVLTVPDNLTALNGYALLIDTRTPFEQLLNSSYSAAISARAVTVSGERANRLIEVHDDVTRGGAVDDNGNVIDGTGEQVAISTDGAALIYLPAGTRRAQITSFHTATADGTVACSTTETITLDDATAGETLADLLDATGIILCPPLDTLLDLDAPPDERTADVLRAVTDFLEWAVLYTESADVSHLELTYPDLPYHPVTNPLFFGQGDDC